MRSRSWPLRPTKGFAEAILLAAGRLADQQSGGRPGCRRRTPSWSPSGAARSPRIRRPPAPARRASSPPRRGRRRLARRLRPEAGAGLRPAGVPASPACALTGSRTAPDRVRSFGISAIASSTPISTYQRSNSAQSRASLMIEQLRAVRPCGGKLSLAPAICRPAPIRIKGASIAGARRRAGYPSREP